MNYFDYYESSGCSKFNFTDDMVSSRYIKKGEVIKQNMIKQKPILKAGDKVKAYIRANGILIGIKLKVLNDAGYGDEVKLYDYNSFKIYKTKLYDKEKIFIDIIGEDI